MCSLIQWHLVERLQTAPILTHLTLPSFSKRIGELMVENAEGGQLQPALGYCRNMIMQYEPAPANDRKTKTRFVFPND